MADLTVLIRLHKHELDEKRMALGKLYDQMAVLEHQRRELLQAFEREKAALDISGDVHFTLANYIDNMKKQQEYLVTHENALAEQIAVAKDSMMETFSELKKYEMTQEERERLAEEERKLRESNAMDAIGLENFRRKEDE